ncbi:MAG: zinc ribbon domain-containing protein [Anaerolineaceae bacterium]
MSDSTPKCTYCGADLKAGAKFCGECGSPTPIPSPFDETPTLQPLSQAPPPPMNETPDNIQSQPKPVTAPVYPNVTPTHPKKKNGWLIAIIVIVVVAVLCCLAIFIVVLLNKDRIQSGIQELNIPAEITGLPTDIADQAQQIAPDNPAEEDIPAPAETTASAFYDFTDGSGGWEVDSVDSDSWGVEEGAYFINIQSLNWMQWIYPPTDFIPQTISFDASIPEKSQFSPVSTYGVICYLLDEDNFYSVEIDPETLSYRFNKYEDGEYYDLLPNSWITLDTIVPYDQGSNAVFVSCDGSSMSLYVNGVYIDEVYEDAMARGGDMAIFVASWESVPEAGAQVNFDNIYLETYE